MNRAEFARWLAGIRPGPHRIVAVSEDGREDAISFSKGPNRWARVANTCFEMKARSVRLFDKVGALIDQCDLVDEEAADETPLTKAGLDTVALDPHRTFSATEVVALLANAQCRIADVVANAVVRAVERTQQSTAATNQVAFVQLSEVTKALTTRVQQLEASAQETIDRQRAELDERREEDSTDKKVDAVMMKLLEAAGPEKLKGVLGVLNGGGGASQ